MRKPGKKQEPLRVVQICDLQAGGIASMILAVCGQLDREKVNFDYLVYRDEEEFWEEQVRAFGGKKLVADNTRAGSQASRFFLKFFRALGVLKKEKARVVHINAPAPYDCLVGAAARLAGARAVILHAHNSRLKKSGVRYRLFQDLCRLCFPLCGNYYFACSDLAGEFFFGKRLRDRVRYVKNGIDTEKFRFDEAVRLEMRERYQVGDSLVLGSIGRFCEQKNQRFLLEIFAELLKIRSDVWFVLIGQGELEGELMRLADTQGLQARLLHIASTDRVPDYLCMMDGFLLPSLYEGLPVVGVEAQAAGLACIFSDSVTREASLTDRAYFLSLGHSADEWARFAAAAAEIDKENRSVYADRVREAGYEIKDTAKWLQEFYLKL